MVNQRLALRQPSFHITPEPGLASGLLRTSVNLLLGFILLGLISACASTPPAPGWVHDDPDLFPAERYFRGISSDRELEAATESALERIAERTQGEPGAEIAETWFDKETELHWAIAVLERQPVLDRLSSERGKIDSAIADALRAGQEDAPEQALPLLATATALAPERDRLIEKMAFLGGTPEPSDGSIKAQNRALSETLTQVKKTLRIEVSAFESDGRSGQPGVVLERNRRALKQKVVSQGFTPGGGDEGWGTEPIWLRVVNTVSIERLELRPNDTLESVQWESAIEITDMAVGGDIVAVLADEGRAVHATASEARRQAAAAAREFAATALEKWLSDQTTETDPSF